LVLVLRRRARFEEVCRTTDAKICFIARMMFNPGLRREMHVLALLLTVYFMCQTWTGKAQYIQYLFTTCSANMVSIASRRFGVVLIIPFSKFDGLQNWATFSCCVCHYQSYFIEISVKVALQNVRQKKHQKIMRSYIHMLRIFEIKRSIKYSTRYNNSYHWTSYQAT